MKRLAIIAAIILSLTALCVPVFAASETGDEEAVVHEELLELGRFAVLGSVYNRGMGKAEIYFGNIEADGTANVFYTWLNDEGLDKPITEYEVLSDGTPEGEAAAELYLQNRTIAPGTEVCVEISEFAPDYKNAEGKIGYQSDVKKLVFGGQADLGPDDYAKLYGCLNSSELYAQDRLIQYEYSIENGVLSVNRVELEPNENADRKNESPKTGAHFAGLPIILSLAAAVINRKR